MIIYKQLPSTLAPSKIRNLIETVASNELQFPDLAIKHFRTQITDEALILKNDDNNTPYFLACDGDQLAGVLLGTAIEGGVATITWLILAPEYRRQGIGKELFDKACAFYQKRGAHKIKLTASTISAVKFYKRIGMEEEGILFNHWWNIDFTSLAIQL